MPVRQISAVDRFAKLRITIVIITDVVNNVKRYYMQEVQEKINSAIDAGVLYSFAK